jgi:hypothetical protein
LAKLANVLTEFKEHLHALPINNCKSNFVHLFENGHSMGQMGNTMTILLDTLEKFYAFFFVGGGGGVKN